MREDYDNEYIEDLEFDDEEEDGISSIKFNDIEDLEEVHSTIIMFEEDYEDIKNSPNMIWFKYEDKIRKIINSLSYSKNFDGEELMQESYIYFVNFCEIYDPYYAGNFFPFDKFLFKNLIIKLRAFIQRYYFKRKREQPKDTDEYNGISSPRNNVNECEDKMYIEYVYSLISKSQREILELSISGYKQREIGEMLNISQSRVSVIRKKTLNYLNAALQNKKAIKKKIKKL